MASRSAQAVAIAAHIFSTLGSPTATLFRKIAFVAASKCGRAARKSPITLARVGMAYCRTPQTEQCPVGSTGDPHALHRAPAVGFGDFDLIGFVIVGVLSGWKKIGEEPFGQSHAGKRSESVRRAIFGGPPFDSGLADSPLPRVAFVLAPQVRRNGANAPKAGTRTAGHSLRKPR